jgi:hypothetical protein
MVVLPKRPRFRAGDVGGLNVIMPTRRTCRFAVPLEGAPDTLSANAARRRRSPTRTASRSRLWLVVVAACVQPARGYGQNRS